MEDKFLNQFNLKGEIFKDASGELIENGLKKEFESENEIGEIN